MTLNLSCLAKLYDRTGTSNPGMVIGDHSTKVVDRRKVRRASEKEDNVLRNIEKTSEESRVTSILFGGRSDKTLIVRNGINVIDQQHLKII